MRSESIPCSRGWAYLLPANYPNEPAVPGFTNFSRTVTLTETEVDLSTPDSSGGYMIVEVEVTLSVSTVLTEYDS
jgi:hypothetical protein